VALGGEVADGVDRVVRKNRTHSLQTADVLPQKDVPAGKPVTQIVQVLGVAGVSQLVHVHDSTREILFFQKKTDEIAADEAAAAGDQ